MLLVFVGAEAREVVREERVPRLPEAFYVLGGPVTCEVTLRVGEDGVPDAARPDNCPAPLWPALEEAALAWRWERGPETTEEIELRVRPPEFSPRGRENGECLVAATVHDDHWEWSGGSRGCAFRAAAPPVADLTGRHQTAWCAVDVVTDREGIVSVEVGPCSRGFAEVAAAAVGSWTFSGEGRWRVLLGWIPHHAGHVDFG
jgi:hypothetical protein